ncbi:MAG TPA: WXG100 family type VII secretion target [Actinophytocola sp.]|nr:WXG100 family type VII secretion target [Actinophytocola sp.]
MDGQMSYDFGSLETLAGSIDGQVSAINTTLEDLRSKVNNLTELYAGAASEGFQATRAEWNNAADHLNQTLARISTAVKTTNADAQATESKNAGRW